MPFSGFTAVVRYFGRVVFVLMDSIFQGNTHSPIYPKLIRAFGAPNGLCSSITESKHIKAVKEPWRRSSRFNPLNQILLTNQRLDKLAASRADFAKRDMLDDTILTSIWENILRMFWNLIIIF
jgi:hypothetical protein